MSISLPQQIILAFGNYMNSSRRGAVYGFRLESLSKVKMHLTLHYIEKYLCVALVYSVQLTDTRSTYDKRQTLLHYIVHVVEKLYPHQLSFYDDLDIDEAAKGESFCGNSDALFMRNTHHITYERLFNYLFNCTAPAPSLFLSMLSCI